MTITAEKLQTYFLASNGQQTGPFTVLELRDWLRTGQISAAAMIWSEGMPNWIPLLQCSDFAGIASASHAPPIPPNSVAPPIPMPSAAPQIPGSALQPVSDGLVWTLAFAPLIGDFAQGFLSALIGISMASLWWVTLALNITLCVYDEKALKKAGYQTKALGSAFLIPVYLYKRSEMLRQGKGYFITWCVVFFVSLYADK